jgi:hypothetical protein
MRRFYLSFLFLSCFWMIGCAAVTVSKNDTAKALAASAHMESHEIPAGRFLLTSYARIDHPELPTTIYIEGDGQAWLSRFEPSRDPTPTDPVALRLAVLDPAPNVIYLARPCQYTKMLDKTACNPDYWTNKRFAPEVIDAMNGALDEIKNHYHLSNFNLVGYSGGGAVAILLTAQRHDISSLRTIAGNLDSDKFTAIHEVSPLNGSLNPASVAVKIATIPQYHFIGSNDQIIPFEIYTSYRQAAGPSSCIHSKVVDEADHHQGWVQIWPKLLNLPVTCTSLYTFSDRGNVPDQDHGDGHELHDSVHLLQHR